MNEMLAAAAPARTIVIERGGTSWWIPLLVAAVAAAASYYATWRFKKADVNRQNAIRAVDLVDEAEQLASRADRYDAEPEGGETVTRRLMQQARVRAQPLDDGELDDRFQAVASFLYDLEVHRGDQPPRRGRHWLGEAIGNVRAALVPHLSAPRLVRRRQPIERSFPTTAELHEMEAGTQDANVVIDGLVEWQAKGAQARARGGNWLRRLPFRRKQRDKVGDDEGE